VAPLDDLPPRHGESPGPFALPPIATTVRMPPRRSSSGHHGPVSPAGERRPSAGGGGDPLPALHRSSDTGVFVDSGASGAVDKRGEGAPRVAAPLGGGAGGGFAPTAPPARADGLREGQGQGQAGRGLRPVAEERRDKVRRSCDHPVLMTVWGFRRAGVAVSDSCVVHVPADAAFTCSAHGWFASRLLFLVRHKRHVPVTRLSLLCRSCQLCRPARATWPTRVMRAWVLGQGRALAQGLASAPRVQEALVEVLEWTPPSPRMMRSTGRRLWRT
jgi:hypothetical protein